MDLDILGSSSKGNCYIIRTSEETLIIEAGVTKRKIQKALDFDYSKVVGCLISHEHLDHCKSLKDVLDMGIESYLTAGTQMGLKFKDPRINIIQPEVLFKVGNFHVMPLDALHDAMQPVGFLIYHKEIGKLLFMTDSYYCKYRFEGLSYIMIECNYDLEILKRNIEAGLVPKILRRRLLASHFSLKTVKELIEASDLSKVQHIYLMHLSDGNSDAKLFKETIQKVSGKPTTIC